MTDVARDVSFFAHRREDRVVTGNDVRIGHGVIVLPGVTAGNGVGRKVTLVASIQRVNEEFSLKTQRTL